MDTKTLATARQQFAQCVFNHKIQEVASERKGGYAQAVTILQLVLTGSAIVLFAIQAAGVNQQWLSVLGIISTAAGFIFTIVQLTYSFDKQAQAHKAAALKYMSLRDRYVEFIADIMGASGKRGELVARRDALSREYQAIGDAPQTTQADYIETQRRLGTADKGGGEQYTWSDSEINSFLPSALRV